MGAIVQACHSPFSIPADGQTFDIIVPRGILTYGFSKRTAVIACVAQQWKTLSTESVYDNVLEHSASMDEDQRVHFDTTPACMKPWEVAEYLSAHMNAHNPRTIVIPWRAMTVNRVAIEESGGRVNVKRDGRDVAIEVTVPKHAMISGIWDTSATGSQLPESRQRVFLLTLRKCRLKWAYDADKDEVAKCVSEVHDGGLYRGISTVDIVK